MNPRHLVVCALLLVNAAWAENVAVDRDDSLFAVVTHKGGFAAAFAHDHLIVADDYSIELSFDPSTPERTTMTFETAADDLGFDDPELRDRWSARLRELAIVDQPLSDISERNRTKVRRSGLNTGQLDADRFPRITARIANVRRRDNAEHPEDFPYGIDLKLTAHGQTVTRSVAARYEAGEDGIEIEAFGTFHFTDFGIEPYSAFLGAVKNRDEFHVYASITLSGAPND